MVRHVRQPARPVGRGKVLVAPPTVAVGAGAAPRALGDVVVEVDVDLVPGEFGGHGVKHLQTGRRGGEARVLGQHLVEHPRPIGLAQGLHKGLLDGDVLPAVGVDLVDHLDGKGQADGVHADALDLLDDGLDGLVLEALGDHDVGVPGPVGAGICQVLARRVEDPAARGHEGSVWPGGAARRTILGRLWAWGGDAEPGQSQKREYCLHDSLHCSGVDCSMDWLL